MNHYLTDAARELTATAKSIDTEAMDVLRSYDWPGNVRQLVNATRRLTVTAPGSVIGTQDLPPEMGGTASRNAPRRTGRAASPAGPNAS